MVGRVRNLVLILVFAGVAALPASASLIVYNNDFGGVISGDDFQEDAFSVYNGIQSVADSFVLSFGSTISEIVIAVEMRPGDTLTSLDWAFLDNSGSPSDPLNGDVIASGTATQFTKTFQTGYNGYDVYSEDFTTPGVALSANTTYWLELNGAIDAYGDGVVYWDQSDGPSTAYSTLHGYLTDFSPCKGLCTGSESFELESGTVPEPGTWPLLAAGVAAVAALRRRVR